MAKVKLTSSDQQMFEVEEEVAFESQTVKNMIEDTGAEEIIPLPNVQGKILAKVIEFCKYHVEANKKTAEDKPTKSEDEVKVGFFGVLKSHGTHCMLHARGRPCGRAVRPSGPRFVAMQRMGAARVSSGEGCHPPPARARSPAASNEPPTHAPQAWDSEFVKVDQSTLFDLILAANYLNIKGLLDLTCQTVAQMIKGKTPEVSQMDA